MSLERSFSNDELFHKDSQYRELQLNKFETEFLANTQQYGDSFLKLYKLKKIEYQNLINAKKKKNTSSKTKTTIIDKQNTDFFQNFISPQLLTVYPYTQARHRGKVLSSPQNDFLILNTTDGFEIINTKQKTPLKFLSISSEHKNLNLGKFDLSPDGTQFVYSTQDKIRIVDLATGQILIKLNNFDSGITNYGLSLLNHGDAKRNNVSALRYSPDGNHLITASIVPPIVRIFNIKEKRIFHEIILDKDISEPRDIFFDNDPNYFYFTDGLLHRVNIQTGRTDDHLNKFRILDFVKPDSNDTRNGTMIQFSKDGLFIYGIHKNTHSLLKINTLNNQVEFEIPVFEYEGKPNPIFSNPMFREFYISNNEKILVAFSTDFHQENHLNFFDAKSGLLLYRMPGELEELYSASLTPDGRYLLMKDSQTKNIKKIDLYSQYDEHI
jgi:hypothetical protein